MFVCTRDGSCITNSLPLGFWIFEFSYAQPSFSCTKQLKLLQLQLCTHSDCCFEGVHKVIHQFPEPSAAQHEPHGEQAVLLWCLWEKLLAVGNAEETPADSHFNASPAQKRTQTGTVFLLFCIESWSRNPISKVEVLKKCVRTQEILRGFTRYRTFLHKYIPAQVQL